MHHGQIAHGIEEANEYCARAQALDFMVVAPLYGHADLEEDIRFVPQPSAIGDDCDACFGVGCIGKRGFETGPGLEPYVMSGVDELGGNVGH